MNRRMVNERFDGIKNAQDLLKLSKERPLTEAEIEALKKCHTGYGGITSNATQFFTPEVVTDFMVDMLGEIKDYTSVLEFSCGSGAFIEALYKKNNKIDVTGIELSYELAQLAELCYPQAKIIQGDALEYMDQFKESFDLIIGNPPFGKSRKNYIGLEYSKKKLEEQFIEMAVHCLKEGGEAILIVPDSVCANQSSINLRKWLIQECYYRASISLPPETFYFSGTSCKTTIIYFKKKFKGHEPDDYPVMMGVCEKIGWDSRGRSDEHNDLEKIKDAFIPIKTKQNQILKCEERRCVHE